jgi:hypothetical protein
MVVGTELAEAEDVDPSDHPSHQLLVDEELTTDPPPADEAAAVVFEFNIAVVALEYWFTLL